jgi:hypothetical protein
MHVEAAISPISTGFHLEDQRLRRRMSATRHHTGLLSLSAGFCARRTAADGVLRYASTCERPTAYNMMGMARNKPQYLDFTSFVAYLQDRQR